MSRIYSRAWSAVLGAIAILLFAHPAHADEFNGYMIQHDPVCAGQETPANQAVWQTVQRYRAALPNIPAWDEVLRQIEDPLEKAADAGDSWASYELGIFVYPLEANLYTRNIPDSAKRISEWKRYMQLSESALQQAAIGGNCYAAFKMGQGAAGDIVGMLPRTQNYTYSNQLEQAQQNIDRAKLNLATAISWCEKGRSLLSPAEASLPFFSRCDDYSKEIAPKIAFYQKQLDDYDGATAKEQARLEAEREAADPVIEAQKRAQLASQQAEEDAYQHDLALFNASKKIAKKVGDDVCDYQNELVFQCGYVERVVNGKVEIILHHEGVAGETVYGEEKYGGSYVVSSTPGIAPSDSHEFRNEYEVGLHSRVTMTLAMHPLNKFFSSMFAARQ